MSAENVDEYHHMYQIPGHIACTRQISGHGVVSAVASIREKLPAARRIGKKVVYVPTGNLAEAVACNIKDLEIKPVKSVNDGTLSNKIILS